MQKINAPDYYSKFSCIGPRCEDTCCSGSWKINIDRDTYRQYQDSGHPVLGPLFKLAVSKNTLPDANTNNNFGLMKMKPDGSCYFQQADKLCAIQGTLGAQALSDTCRLYPRYLNQFGARRENAIGISCPESARLILLNPQPMEFSLISPTSGVDDRPAICYRFPVNNEGDSQQIEVLNDFRALIIAILQSRSLSLGARVMTLGFLLEEANQIVNSAQFAHAAELSPILSDFAGMLAYPAQIEAQFAQIQANIPRKLALMTELIAKSLMVGAAPRLNECLRAAVEGLEANPTGAAASDGDLLSQYHQNYQNFYLPFFQERTHIFENYLVNQVITRLFPFTRGSYLDLYREMVFNLSILQVLLVGMAARHKGLDEEKVVQLFQSFARKSDHNSSYLKNLIESIAPGEHDSFVHVMWLLQEIAP